jgi:hypothetical protein
LLIILLFNVIDAFFGGFMAITIIRIPNNLTQYPKHLTDKDLILTQPAIIKTLMRQFIFSKTIATLISEYVCTSDKVDTQAMIRFFESEIPSIVQMDYETEHSDVSSAFHEKPYQRNVIFRNSTPLSNTSERKLAALAMAYFGYRNYVHKLQLSPEEAQRMDPNNQEYYDFLGRIPGITIINTCIAAKDDRVSHFITFGNQDWYKGINPRKTLHEDPKKVLRFLTQKGYQKSEKPALGQIVVYHTIKEVNHYGKIAEIDSDNQIMVISKFGQSHFCKHRLELVQIHYGNSVTFLQEPLKSKLKKLSTMSC